LTPINLNGGDTVSDMTEGQLVIGALLSGVLAQQELRQPLMSH
jgi:hypothetical protein